MKLELKHLAGYLPYGLKIRYIERNETHIFDCNNLNAICSEQIHLKPILRPLSDLTKEIEVNGEKFVPFEKLEFLYKDFYFAIGNENELIVKYKNSSMYVLITEYNKIIENLYEWHFDIYGLIEKGLAIDINKI